MSYLLNYNRWRNLHESRVFEQDEKKEDVTVKTIVGDQLQYVLCSGTDVNPWRDYMIQKSEYGWNIESIGTKPVYTKEDHQITVYTATLKDALLGNFDNWEVIKLIDKPSGKASERDQIGFEGTKTTGAGMVEISNVKGKLGETIKFSGNGTLNILRLQNRLKLFCEKIKGVEPASLLEKYIGKVKISMGNPVGVGDKDGGNDLAAKNRFSIIYAAVKPPELRSLAIAAAQAVLAANLYQIDKIANKGDKAATQLADTLLNNTPTYKKYKSIIKSNLKAPLEVFGFPSYDLNTGVKKMVKPKTKTPYSLLTNGKIFGASDVVPGREVSKAEVIIRFTKPSTGSKVFLPDKIDNYLFADGAESSTYVAKVLTQGVTQTAIKVMNMLPYSKLFLTPEDIKELAATYSSTARNIAQNGTAIRRKIGDYFFRNVGITSGEVQSSHKTDLAAKAKLSQGGGQSSGKGDATQVDNVEKSKE
jgi:hypothetical protein